MAVLPSLDELLRCAPTWRAQLTLVLGFALLWAAVLPRIEARVHARLAAWPQRAAYVQRIGRACARAGVDHGDCVLEATCRGMACIAQHLCGGLLCLPAVCPALGLPPRLAARLACHGAASEAGWELQDLLTRAREWRAHPRGAQLTPPLLMAICVTHHALGLLMVLPMNVRHAESGAYHELVFLLQAASAAALGINYYVLSLDLARRRQRLQMQLLATLAMLMFVHARCTRFGALAWRLLAMLRASGDTALFCAGCVAIGAMLLTNVLFTVDSVVRFAKFVLGVDLEAISRKRRLCALAAVVEKRAE